MTPTDPLEAAAGRLVDAANAVLFAIDKLQRPNRTMVEAADFLRGAADEVGDSLAHHRPLIEAATPRPAVPGEGVDFTDPDVLSGATPRPAGVDDTARVELNRLYRLIISYADLTHEVVWSGGDWKDIAREWGKVVDEARAAVTGSEEPLDTRD